jgi:predicted metal-dependent hydrolase
MTATFNPVSVHQKGASFPFRRMDFDLRGAHRYFIDNDPVSSMLWLAFQSYFLEGEQFFVDAVRSVRGQITDERLQKEISAFIGQEAMHGKEHLMANEEARRQGVNVSRLDRAARRNRQFVKRYLLKRKGFFTEAVPELLRYYSPSLHPNETDAAPLLDVFIRELDITAADTRTSAT